MCNASAPPHAHVHVHRMRTTLCARQARPALAVVLEQLQGKALFAVDPSGSTSKVISWRCCLLPQPPSTRTFGPGLLCTLRRRERLRRSADPRVSTALPLASAKGRLLCVSHIQLGALCAAAAASARRVARRRRADVARQETAGQRARRSRACVHTPREQAFRIIILMGCVCADVYCAYMHCICVLQALNQESFMSPSLSLCI